MSSATYEGLLGSLKSYFPHGMVVIRDSFSEDEVPSSEGREPQVLAASDIILSPIQHEVDGLASVAVWTGPRRVDERIIFDGNIRLDSGKLLVSTVGEDEMLGIRTALGMHHIQIFGDDQEYGTPNMLILISAVESLV